MLFRQAPEHLRGQPHLLLGLARLEFHNRQVWEHERRVLYGSKVVCHGHVFALFITLLLLARPLGVARLLRVLHEEYSVLGRQLGDTGCHAGLYFTFW